MTRRRYDQRVLALVEVRGEPRDFEQAKAEFAGQRWPVVDEFGRGEGPSAGVLSPDPRARLFWVEVRLFGARNERTERAAGWRVRGLAKTAVLEMYVRRTQLVDPDREQLEEYRSHTTAHRPDPRRAVGRWVRAAENSGWYDTGSIALGTPSEARRLARMGLPGSAPARADLDVRMSPRRGRRAIELRREDDFMRRLARMFGWLLGMAFAAGCFREVEGHARWLWLAVGCGCLARGLFLASGLAASQGRLFGFAGGCLGALALLLFVYGVPGLGTAPWTPRLMLLDTAVVVTPVGIWLLVRQWTTWTEWLTATVPLAVTMAAGLVVASGSVLHGLYGDGLDLTPDELDVPGLWQVVAGAKLVSYLGVGLLGPALWGIAKHFHFAFTRPGEYLNVAVYVLLYVVVVASLASFAMDNAARAVERTKAAAEHRGQAPPYFGVQPEWVCVQPTVAVAELNAEGGLLDPGRPYLFFGVADDVALLWNTDTDAPLKERTDQVRLVPTRDPARACPRTGG
ncbi:MULTISPECIES: NnrS multi-domain protein [unclassified Streptomyces]|uniref:NnrS multi-domain protein n=1 Tax=unclassified Streptomyces TaxID=2593676 RepID=UPI001BEA6859|nr:MULTISPECIES: NnrS multi-domain protein [unclassified Streptomyces]MBT2407017.1 NnrS multi-domain protein [Streptomyces sp. ISL-21]MBT2611768.1 NnrS multi-domain protein [Streptomyces sp. ISL-87]